MVSVEPKQGIQDPIRVKFSQNHVHDVICFASLSLKKKKVLRVNFLLGVTVDKSLININLSNKTYRKM